MVQPMNPRKLLQKALASPNNFRFAEARALAEAFGFRLSRVSVHGQAKPYQIKQLLQLVERHNLELAGDE